MSEICIELGDLVGGSTEAPTCQLITLTIQLLFQTPVEEAWGRSGGTGMAENVQTGDNTCTCDFP